MFGAIVGDVASGMAGYLNDPELQARFRQIDYRVFMQPVADMLNLFIGRAIDRHRRVSQQRGNATNMVSMMVSE